MTNNQINGLNTVLCEMQIEFNNALKDRNYCVMGEIITEMRGIKDDHTGNYLCELSKKT